MARDAEVIASIARGRPQGEVATDYGLTPRQVRRIIAAWRSAREDVAIEPAAEVSATLDLLEQAIADLARIEEAPDNDAAHIGATRLKADLRLRRDELMLTLGLLPRPSVQVAERELQQIFRELAELAREHEVGDEFIDAVLTLSERRLHRPPTALASLVGAAA